jgi:hypothetical protein
VSRPTPLRALRRAFAVLHTNLWIHTPVARCGLATGSSSSLVEGFPIYQRARARGRCPPEEGIGYPTGHRTNRRTLGARAMTLTLGGWSEGQALHTSSDVMGRYIFPRTRLSRWLGPTNTPSSTRRLESNSQFFHGRSRTHDLAIMRSTLYPIELLPRTDRIRRFANEQCASREPISCETTAVAQTSVCRHWHRRGFSRPCSTAANPCSPGPLGHGWSAQQRSSAIAG